MRVHHLAAVPRAGSRESGIAFILGIMFAIIVSGLVVSGALVLQSTRTKTDVNFRLHGQAAQFARAGLTEALGWFRRQSTQPVTAFVPVLDPIGPPPILDTLDPEVGIVREFEISGVIWGRYEVWKRWDADPDPVRLLWRQQVQVEDVSTERGAAGAGNVWRVRSVGYVFRRVNGAVAYNRLPNQVLGKEILETEVRRMTLSPPGAAAICMAAGNNLTIDNKVNIQGAAGAGVFYAGGAPTLTNSPKVSGTPALSFTGIYNGSVTDVFGVTEDELRSLADDRILSDPLFPSPVPPDTLYFAEVPTLTFTATRPLRGHGIVYVKGNIDLQVGSTSFFTGLIYVNGNATIREPLELDGTIVVTGTTTIRGTSDWCNINYDGSALNSLRTQIGQYRMSRAIRSLVTRE